MKRNYFFIVFLSLFFLVGCGNSGKTTITIGDDLVYLINIEDNFNNVSTIKLSEIADSIRYIELKTPDSLPIGTVTNIKLSDEYLFITFKGTAYQFNHRGEYLRQIGKRGQGPGEYPAAGQIFVNDNEKTVKISSANRLYSYSYDGKFIEQKPMKGMIFKDSLSYTANPPFGRDKYKMVILNSLLDTIGGIPNYVIYDANFSISLNLRFRQPFYEYGENIYFKGYQDNDTIWRINGTEYKIHAIIDRGKYKYPESKNENDLRLFFNNFTQKKGDYYMVLYAMEDNHFIYLDLEPYFNLDMGSPRLLFDKHQKTGFVIKNETGDYGFIDDIQGGPAFWPQIMSGNYYISVTQAGEFIKKSQSQSASSRQFKEFLQKIDEESNPIVTIVTTKHKTQ